MPYDISWYREQRIIYTRWQGNVTIEEVVGTTQTVLDLLNAGQAPVHLLIDVIALGKFPTSVLQLRSATSAYLEHPWLGWMILIGGSGLATALARIVAQIHGVRFRAFNTLDEALDFLSSVDRTLADPSG